MKVKDLIAALSIADPEAYVLLPDVGYLEICDGEDFKYFGEQALLELVEIGWCSDPTAKSAGGPGEVLMESDINFTLNQSLGLTSAVRLVAHGDDPTDPKGTITDMNAIMAAH